MTGPLGNSRYYISPHSLQLTMSEARVPGGPGHIDPEAVSLILAVFLQHGGGDSSCGCSGTATCPFGRCPALLAKCVQASLVCTSWRAAAGLLGYCHLAISDALIRGVHPHSAQERARKRLRHGANACVREMFVPSLSRIV